MSPPGRQAECNPTRPAPPRPRLPSNLLLPLPAPRAAPAPRPPHPAVDLTLAQQGNTEVEAGDPAVKEMGEGGGVPGVGSGEALRTSRQRTIKVSASQWTWLDRGLGGRRASQIGPRRGGSLALAPSCGFYPTSSPGHTPDLRPNLGWARPGEDGGGVRFPLPSALRVALSTCLGDRRHSSACTPAGLAYLISCFRPETGFPYSAGRLPWA